MGKVRRKVRFALAYELGLYSYIPRVPPIFEMENEKYFRDGPFMLCGVPTGVRNRGYRSASGTLVAVAR
jgi:hypothetical protein